MYVMEGELWVILHDLLTLKEEFNNTIYMKLNLGRSKFHLRKYAHNLI